MNNKLYRGQRHIIPLNGKWQEWYENDIQDGLNSKDKATRDFWGNRASDYNDFLRNRLAYYLPHCDGADFINDRENDLCLLTKGNQNGGTSHGIAFILFRSLKCGPDWHTFKNHGIKYYPFQGPKRVLIATWSWDNMKQAIWPEFLKLMPRDELGEYAPNFGDPDLFPEEAISGLKAKSVSFNSNVGKEFVAKISKSQFFFRVYTQPQHAFESTQFDLALCDEQIPEDKFDGLDERGRTRPNFQVCFPLTGHKLPGFPDTGKGGWIYRKLYLVQDTKGHSLAKYKLWIDGVPDILYSKEQKAIALEKHVTTPRANKDKKAIRIGEARYYGGFEGESENVVDNFDREQHVIGRFELPPNVTYYRGIDHGRVRPTACVVAAMFPWGDILISHEYYEKGKVVPYNCPKIVEMCGNRRLKLETQEDEVTGTSWTIYEEEFVKMNFASSVMDSRSFVAKVPDRDITVGQLYNDCGLSCTPAHGIVGKDSIPLFQRWLEVDTTRKHFMWHAHNHHYITDEDYANWLKIRGGVETGGSKLVVFGDLRFWIMEVETWMNKGETDKPLDENNHLMDATMYVLSENPYWQGDEDNDAEAEEDVGDGVSKVTGY